MTYTMLDKDGNIFNVIRVDDLSQYKVPEGFTLVPWDNASHKQAWSDKEDRDNK
jgi:hypothetical protein